ncbi:MAG: 5'/3'-nucleotidase SurE [Candidatus Hodarchaeales archaeon]|jgi:5'-nucleotidase
MPVEILLSNDDGIYSSGIRALASTMIKHKWEVTVIAPHLQRSGEGKSITFEKPIRIQEVSLSYLEGKNGWSTTGTPADAIIHGIYQRANCDKSPYDLIVSGINSGENTSVHSILTSGTCAVAFEAALLGFPAIAFSIDVPENCFFNDYGGSPGLDIAAKSACDIISKVIEQGLPPSVGFLNVNFPDTISEDTPIEICRMAMTKYHDYTIRHEDPRGVPYYWIWGETHDIPQNTDAYAVLKKKVTSVTPITLHFDSRDNPSVDKELEYLMG